jgi:hypothetical protein
MERRQRKREGGGYRERETKLWRCMVHLLIKKTSIGIYLTYLLHGVESFLRS